MADVKLTMEADVAQVVRANNQLVESERQVEKQFARTASEKEAATRRIVTSTQQGAAAIQAYDLAPLGGAGGEAVRLFPARGRAASPRPFGLAPLVTGQPSGSGLIIPTAIGGASYRLADEVAMEARGYAGLSRMDLLLARGQRIADAAKSRTTARNELEAELAELRLRARDTRRTEQLDFRKRLATGALAVGAAVAGLAASAEEELNRYAETISSFENTMTPLYGVGANMRIRPQLRQRVLAVSGGSGVPAAQIAELMGQLQSTFGDLPPEVSQEIVSQTLFSRKLGVQNLPQFAIGLGGMYQAFGGKFGGGVGAARILSNMFERSADVGGFQKDQITPYLARVMQNFGVAGYSPAEAFAALALVSRSGLEPEVYATGLANMSLDLLKGNASGKFRQTGSLAGDLRSLAAMPPAQRLELLGERGFPVANLLTSQQEIYARMLGPIQASTARENVVGGKITGAWTDRIYGNVSTIQSARQMQANAIMLNADVRPDLLNAVTDWELRKAGAELTTHPMFGWFKKPQVWMETAISGIDRFLTDDDRTAEGDLLLRVGAATAASQARQAGDEVKASYIELAYGLTGARRTGRDEAEAYRRMIGAGYVGLTGGEFLEYRRLQKAGGTAADDYLKRVGGFQDPNPQTNAPTDPLMNLAAAAEAAANYLNSNQAAAVPRLPIGVAAPGP